MKKAFSLMELMVVIIILGLLAAFVLPNLTGQSEQAKRKLACIQMESLAGNLRMFRLDNGRYPTTEEGLNALAQNPNPEDLRSFPRGGYLQDGRVPKDPWDGEYIYIYNDGDDGGEGFDIISFGSDRKEGGSGDNEDIYFSKCQ